MFPIASLAYDDGVDDCSLRSTDPFLARYRIDRACDVGGSCSSTSHNETTIYVMLHSARLLGPSLLGSNGCASTIPRNTLLGPRTTAYACHTAEQKQCFVFPKLSKCSARLLVVVVVVVVARTYVRHACLQTMEPTGSRSMISSFPPGSYM